MTTADNIARARKRIADIRAKIAEGGTGKWSPVDDCIVRDDQGLDVAHTLICNQCPPVGIEHHARNIAAAHNAMPTALDFIEYIVDESHNLTGDGTGAHPLVWDAIMSTLESLDRDFGVEVDHE